VVQADAHGGRPVPAHELVRDPQSEEDRLSGIGDAQHCRVADRLDLTAAGWELGADRPAELRDERGRVVIAVRLGQRREAGDVREDERRLDGVRVAPAHCVAALTMKPPGGM